MTTGPGEDRRQSVRSGIAPGHVWRRLGIVCWLLWGPSANAAPVESPAPLPDGYQIRTLDDESGTHQYVIYVPGGPMPEQGWPVLLFLHGAGQRGTDPRQLISNTVAVAIERTLARGDQWPFLTILPHCEDINSPALTAWSASAADGRRALKILDDVRRAETTDPRQCVLAGWSMGGYGAWSLAATSSQLFSRVLIVSGGGDVDSLPLSELARKRIPVWAIHGSRDALIPEVSSRRLVQRLNELEGAANFTSLPAGHDVWKRVLAQRRVLEWMQGVGTDFPDDELPFNETPPLPSWTAWYRNNVTVTHTLVHGLDAAIDNENLDELSATLRDALVGSAEALTGNLDDLHREFGEGAGAINAELRGLKYTARVTDVRVQAISGGWARLTASLGIELGIAETEIATGEHWARAEHLNIQFGRHQPAKLIVDVQPLSATTGVQLKLLQSQFQCGEDNWYIHPPTHIDVRSPTYTKWHISTGLVGSLYLARDEIVEQILSTVPGLLRRAESQLRDIPAPQLAKLLSPLPVLVPDVRLSPSRIRVSPGGLAAQFDLRTMTNGIPGATELSHPPHDLLNSPPRGAAAEIALDAISELSRLNISQNLMQVNLLDISEDRFSHLTQPTVMREVFGDSIPSASVSLRGVLRLLEPLEISPLADSRPTTPGTTHLLMSAPAAAVDFWQQSADGARAPLGRIVFSLSQPVSVQLVHQANGDEVNSGSLSVPPQRVTLHWDPVADVRVLRVDPLDGVAAPEVNTQRFAELFREAWQAWARDNGQQQFDLATLGNGLQLSELDINATRLRLEFSSAGKPR